MSLSVHPDPEEPAGGYAFLELAADSLPDAPVTVAVMEVYGERWLAPSGKDEAQIAIGDANWQSDRHEYGPYKVHRYAGADWVRIGPDIVNKLEEYTPLRISVDGKSFDVTWPDDVPPRARAAVLGGIQPVERKVHTDAPGPLVGRLAAASAAPAPKPEMVAPILQQASALPAAAGREPEEEPADRSGVIVIALFLLASVAVAAATWWFYFADHEPAPESAAVIPGGQTVAADGNCTLQTLSALTGGFVVIEQAIRTCGRNVAPDTALRLIEDAASANDPGALLLFGTLYDGEALDPRIENLIGLTFEDDPARAVEYYGRAVQAGSVPARDRLTTACAKLSALDATLDKGAYDDFCR